VPGYLSIDEATYHLMTKHQSEGRGLEVWNGYRELPSPELVSSSIVAHQGILVGRPPAIHPALAVPFYRLAGFRGLFALNALAFAGAAGLAFLLARRLFGNVDLALDAVLLLVAATFAWQYSQAAWTHATAMLFTLGAFTLAVFALLERRSRRAMILAVTAGLIAGLAVGIRLDSAFLLATIGLLFLFRSPWMPRRALALAAGAAPGLALLMIHNQLRFGTWSPFSMGKNVGLEEIKRYLPLLAFGLLLLLVAWALSRQPVRRWLRRRHALRWVAAGLVLLALALPTGRRLLAREARGVYTLGIDLRALDLDRREPAMLRSDNRAVLYIGGVKKALLQSCPYLVLLLLPALRLATKRRPGVIDGDPDERVRIALLFTVPLAYLAFYAQFSWHGGLSLNLRYLTPVLPATSILVAWALRRPEVVTNRWRGSVVAVLVSAALFLAIRQSSASVLGDELLVQSMPLALAGALLVALLLALRRRLAGDPPQSGGRWRVVAPLAAAAIAWSGLTAFVYDLPLTRATRAFNLETGRQAARLVEPDSLFFADFVDPFFLLIETERVRIARPGLDRYRDMRRLTQHHLAAGRAVYGAFPPPVWEALAGGPLAGFSLHALWRAELFTLARIEGETTAQTAPSPH
jgi:hypothetical protein